MCFQRERKIINIEKNNETIVFSTIFIFPLFSTNFNQSERQWFFILVCLLYFPLGFIYTDCFIVPINEM